MSELRETRNTVARDLMTTEFSTLGSDQPLREAITELVALQSHGQTPNAIVVVDEDGRYEGLLTARLLFRSLLALWSPGKAVRDDDARLDEELLGVVLERSQLPVRVALMRGLPTTGPSTRLPELIELSCDKRMEFLPVLEDGRPTGLVPITRIFLEIAELALTPEDAGIHLGRRD